MMFNPMDLAAGTFLQDHSAGFYIRAGAFVSKTNTQGVRRM
jgi:hypothetical protein